MIGRNPGGVPFSGLTKAIRMSYRIPWSSSLRTAQDARGAWRVALALAGCLTVAVVSGPTLVWGAAMGPGGWTLAVLAGLLACAVLVGAWWMSGQHRWALDLAAERDRRLGELTEELRGCRAEEERHQRRSREWEAWAAARKAHETALAAMLRHLAYVQLPAVLRGRPAPPTRADKAVTAELLTLRDHALAAAGEAWREYQDRLESQELTLVRLSRRVQPATHRIQRRAETLAERYRDLPEVYGTCQDIDHLAAQAARTAQSLAVVCGTWEGQQWQAPLRLAEVVQGAKGRIEDYLRVEVEGDPDIAIAPAALEATMHVLAELLDNATCLSPTATTVLVRVDAAARGAAFRIDDHGAGLEEPRLSRGLAVLSGARPVSLPELGEIPRLGMAVVGRYARRFGFQMGLDRSPYGGLRATMLVPQQWVVSAPPNAAPPEPTTPPARTPPWSAPSDRPEPLAPPVSSAPPGSSAPPVARPPEGAAPLAPTSTAERNEPITRPAARPEPPWTLPQRTARRHEARPETPTVPAPTVAASAETPQQAGAFLAGLLHDAPNGEGMPARGGVPTGDGSPTGGGMSPGDGLPAATNLPAGGGGTDRRAEVVERDRSGEPCAPGDEGKGS